jgi:hypothetical protein
MMMVHWSPLPIGASASLPNDPYMVPLSVTRALRK